MRPGRLSTLARLVDAPARGIAKVCPMREKKTGSVTSPVPSYVRSGYEMSRLIARPDGAVGYRGQNENN